ncbi:MAG: hypothetical protein ACHP9U_01615 [Steroidobacterales bacterium]
MITLGIRVYALGALALGLVGLAWDDFALQWQPVPAGVPGRAALACVFAAALVAAAVAVNLRPAQQSAPPRCAACSPSWCCCTRRRS